MKRIKKVLFMLLIVMPIFIKSEEYSNGVDKAYRLLEKKNYVNTYKKYIVNGANIPFEYDGNENKVNSSFSNGGFISIQEFNLTKRKNASYLFDGVEYWTLTKDGEKIYAITYDDIETSKNKLSDYSSRVTEFVNPGTTIHGEGKISNPWVFDTMYKVSAKVDDRYATIMEGNNAYVKADCENRAECKAKIKIQPKDNYMYITNNCGGTYDEDTKELIVKNVKRDTLCSVIFGTGKFTITLNGGTPNKIYLRFNENYYLDEEMTQIIKNIESIESKQGYRFTGYYYNGHLIIGEDKRISYDSIKNRYITSDVELNPSYDLDKYNITYDYNGGTPPSNGIPSSYFTSEGAVINGEPTRIGYTFIGWSERSSLSSPSLVKIIDIGETGDKKYYAAWRKNKIIVRFNANGGTLHGVVCFDFKDYIQGSIRCSQTLEYDGQTPSGGLLDYNDENCINIEKTGYTAQKGAEWKCISGSGCKNSNDTFSQSQVLEANRLCDARFSDCIVALYVNWVENQYTVAYKLNGGSQGLDAPISGNYDSALRISNPTKTVTIIGNGNSSGASIGSNTSASQTFSGWTSESIETGAKTGSESSSIMTSWPGTSTKNTYFKNLRNDTGTVTMVANWTPVAISCPTVQKRGYSCSWYSTSGTSGGSKMCDSGGSYTPSETSETTINMYARCKMR